VDGCDLRCAARATEKYSSKPAASVVINDLVCERGLARPEGRRRLNDAGRQAVEVAAEHVAKLVDEVLGADGRAAQTGRAAGDSQRQEPEEATCACGSGVPVLKVAIRGEVVEVVALPLIFKKFRDAGGGVSEGVARELFDTVRIYNDVPAAAEADYREAILREYAAYLKREG